MTGPHAAVQPGRAVGLSVASQPVKGLLPHSPGLREPQLRATPAATYLPNGHQGGPCMDAPTKGQVNRTPTPVKNQGSGLNA